MSEHIFCGSFVRCCCWSQHKTPKGARNASLYEEMDLKKIIRLSLWKGIGVEHRMMASKIVMMMWTEKMKIPFNPKSSIVDQAIRRLLHMPRLRKISSTIPDVFQRSTCALPFEREEKTWPTTFSILFFSHHTSVSASLLSAQAGAFSNPLLSTLHSMHTLSVCVSLCVRTSCFHTKQTIFIFVRKQTTCTHS